MTILPFLVAVASFVTGAVADLSAGTRRGVSNGVRGRANGKANGKANGRGEEGGGRNRRGNGGRGKSKGKGKGKGIDGGDASDATLDAKVVIITLQQDGEGRGDVGRGGGRGRGKDNTGPKTATRGKNKEYGAVTGAAARAAVSAACDAAAAAVGGTVVHVYDAVLGGCAVEMPAATAAWATAALVADSRVQRVEDNGPVYPQSLWGLDRVDQCDLPLDGNAAKVDATGVRMYVVDTGIYQEHDDFKGMIDPTSSCHEDFTGEDKPFDDGNGHGTHVAGTACGADHGVATCDDLCAIRVFDSGGGGSWADVIAGVNHIVSDCAGAFPDAASRTCVANLSLGGPRADAIDAAVADAVDEGVVMVVAAGNYNQDACAYSPARVPAAVTVGSTTVRDKHSSFSNYGECVDVYGPGSDVTSAGTDSPAATATLSGTSMASPHVAAIAAGFLHEDPALDPAGVAERIQQDTAPLDHPAQEGFAMALATTVGNCRAPTQAPTPFSCDREGHAQVSVDILTDAWPAETEWTLQNNCDTSQAVVKGAWDLYTARNTRYTNSYCLPWGTAEYTFNIKDSYGDGLCCDKGPGSYAVSVDGVEMISGGEFAYSETKTFGSCNS